MVTAQQLWQSYHAAVRDGNTALANRILQQIHKYKRNPTPTGGCGKCRRRLT
jgi:hypothetical protein